MAENRVGIVIEGRNKSAAAFNEVKGQLAGLDGAAKTAMGGFGGLAGMVAGGFAVSQIIGITKELVAIGAQAERTEASFHRVAQSYGADADKMLAAMKRAAGGQISNDELMMAANKAMMLGVTADADQMAGLLQAAMERGQAMGRTAADAFNDIVIGIGRMSPLILDNLGIMTGGEAAFAAYAASIGKTAEQLTDFERRQMLINKVLADAGPVTLDSQAKIASLGVAWANLRAEMGKDTVAHITMLGIPEALNSMADVMAARRRVTEAFAEAGATEAQQLVAFVGLNGRSVSMPGIQDAELRRQREAIESLFVAYDAGRISIEQLNTELASDLAILASHQAAAEADAAAMGIMRAGFDGVGQSAALAAASMSVVTRHANELAGAALRTIGPLTQAAAALSAWDLVVGALVPNLDSVSESTTRAVERIEGIGLGGVDVLGASGAIEQIGAYKDAMQSLRDKAIALKWDDLELATAQQVLFNQFGNQISGLRKVTGATSTYNAELSALLSTTEKFISASVGSTKGLVNFGDQGLVNGFDPNGPAQDFGRMWDVAVNGFNSQWLDELRATGLIPDDVIAAGEAALKAFAEGKAKAFQSGADLGMLDTDKIVAQVRAELDAQRELERIKAEVVSKLHEGGLTGARATAAVDKVLGTGTGTDAGGNTAGKGFQDGFVTGLVGLGTKITTELSRQMVVQAVALATAGKDAGDKFAGGFTERAGDLPGWFLDFLAGQLTPLVEARIKANATRSQPPTGAQP
ncbi:hypothetical protein [Candidatus Amarolinea dominans]|uniref:hypothetical protein n=1 Tax=Candidatus Amarolinea dominans TaxID=3140696 RepID=UPI00313482AF|nr:hypothetical protein [Anaerolineae bacterium]